MTIVDELRELDQEIIGLFRKYEEANRGSTEEKRQLATEIFVRLHIHVGLAEALLYEPLSLVSNDSQQALIEDKLGEHRVIASLIGDLRWQDSTQQDHKDGFGLLAKTVERHIKEEEETVFAKAVDVLGGKLDTLGSRAGELKDRLLNHANRRYRYGESTRP